MKTVLITGVNSTLGHATMTYFISKNWNVIGTVRDISKNPTLQNIEGLSLLELDLTNKASLNALSHRISDLDVLVNNIGHVLCGPLESYTEEQYRREFDVNFFGSVQLIQSFIPIFKRLKKGCIINISSVAGLTTFPLLSMYHASKWALEGFSESLRYELLPFNIQIKLIEPGGIENNNYENKVEFGALETSEYDSLVQKVFQSKWFPSFSTASSVAEVIFQAATDNTNKLRYMVGESTTTMLNERLKTFESEDHLRLVSSRIENNG